MEPVRPVVWGKQASLVAREFKSNDDPEVSPPAVASGHMPAAQPRHRGQNDVGSDGAIIESQLLRRSCQGEDARRPVSRVLSARSPKVSRGTTIPLGRALPRASRDQP